MSSIYIQEPPTSGKVLLKTSVGDIDIELWSKECPKTCRNFLQLCMEGYYNDTIFHRVVKGFIVQGGDPNGDGTGGESIYDKPFKDEFHSRLRYTRRGLVGMANSDKDDNASQFFFTMGPTQELENKNTLFGKVTGDTVFNMLKLEDGLVDHNERPFYPHKIIRTEILNNPFSDINPRIIKKEKKEKKSKKIEKGVKNFGLLSFGEEAEVDEEETNDFVQKNAGKAKSMHDMVNDPKLSKDTIKSEIISDTEEIVLEQYSNVKLNEENEDENNERKQRIKEKLQNKASIVKVKKEILDEEDMNNDVNIIVDDDYDLDELMTLEKEKKLKTEQKKNQIRQEIMTLKKEYQTEKKNKAELLEKKTENETIKGSNMNSDGNEMIKTFNEEKEKYSSLKLKMPTKGTNREVFTLELLKSFRKKLDNLKQENNENDEYQSKPINDEDVEKEIQTDNWLTHTFQDKEEMPVLAKDASTKDDDWYDAYDPRNPINKRRRGESSKSKTTHKDTKRKHHVK